MRTPPGPRLRHLRIAVLLLACTATRAGALSAEEPAPAVEVSVFFIGDAGSPDPKGEPVLAALARELARDASRSVTVFLGDNVYPSGLPEASSPARAEAERRLDAQIAAVRTTGARGIFVPGNHDWARHGPDGWAAVRRQAQYVEGRAPGVSFLPRDGCPGPAVADLASRLRLVILDTQWWLHGGPKPRDPDSDCDADSEAEVLASLRAAIAGAGARHVAVIAHHPLESGGTHGGHFGWKDHVFPLRAWKSWLWFPLPVIGSAYPLARKSGAFSQDVSDAGYRHMRAALGSALSAQPPLLWVAGHDHALQVLRGTSARHMLVTGAGTYGHTRTPAQTRATEFRSGGAGFMRLDVESSGRVRLRVLVVDREGSATERFSRWLDGEERN